MHRQRDSFGVCAVLIINNNNNVDLVSEIIIIITEYNIIIMYRPSVDKEKKR